MPILLQDLPFFRNDTQAAVPGGSVRIKDHQIIVWVSVMGAAAMTFPPGTPRFPAILDPGNTFGFSIQEQQLLQWGGVSLQGLTQSGHIRISGGPGAPLPLYDLRVWLHANVPGQRDRCAARPPFWLGMGKGIAVYPLGSRQPARLPLLGLRALVHNRMHLIVDGDRCLVTLTVP